MRQRLNDLRRLQKTVVVLQNQYRRTVAGRQSVDCPDGGQRITRLGGGLAATDRQTLVDVPDSKPPIFAAAGLGDFQDGVLVFAAFDPDASEAAATSSLSRSRSFILVSFLESVPTQGRLTVGC